MRQTSIIAYQTIQSSGLLSRMRWRVYDCLYHHGPMTAGELTLRLKGPNEVHPSYHRRLDELREMGVAMRTFQRPCAVTGHLADEWDVTSALPGKRMLEPTWREQARAYRTKLEDIRLMCLNAGMVAEEAYVARELANIDAQKEIP